jgi:membrane protein implicated in regulation of membrane protease activity
VAVVDRLKLCLLVLVVLASGLGLLALAVLVVLTNTAALVITLAILGTIVFLLARRGLSGAEQEFRTKAGG